MHKFKIIIPNYLKKKIKNHKLIIIIVKVIRMQLNERKLKFKTKSKSHFYYDHQNLETNENLQKEAEEFQSTPIIKNKKYPLAIKTNIPKKLFQKYYISGSKSMKRNIFPRVSLLSGYFKPKNNFSALKKPKNQNYNIIFISDIWKRKAFIIIFYVSIFISKIKEVTLKNRFRKLNNFHYKLISDFTGTPYRYEFFQFRKNSPRNIKLSIYYCSLIILIFIFKN